MDPGPSERTWTPSSMSPPNQPTALSMLQRLFEAANAAKARLESCAFTPAPAISPPALEVRFAHYELPLPPSITEKLVGLGLNAAQTAALSAKYTTCCETLRTKATTAVRGACQQANGLPGMQRFMQKLIVEHELAYKHGLQRLEAATLSIVDRLKSHQREEFNYDFLPYLETAFATNPKPSRADQLVMAKKSGMSRRQIQVWFQNHRARAKRANQDNKTSPTSQRLPYAYADDEIERYIEAMEAALDPIYVVPRPYRQDVDELNSSSPPFTVASPSTGGDDDDDDDDAEDETEYEPSTPESETEGPFDFTKPWHRADHRWSFAELCKNATSNDAALPTPLSGTFSVPEWRRSSATSQSSRPTDAASWNALPAAFAALHLHGRPLPTTDGVQPVPPPSIPVSWKPATITVPPRTPLPALFHIPAGSVLLSRRDRSMHRLHQFGRASFPLRDSRKPRDCARRLSPPNWSLASSKVEFGGYDNRKRDVMAMNNSATTRAPAAKRQRCR